MNTKDDDKSKAHLLAQLSELRKQVEVIGNKAGSSAETSGKEHLFEPPALVMVVDDNDESRNIAATILRRKNYNVIEASDSREAFGFCENLGQTLKLILCDVVLLDESGIELMEKIKAINPQVKVIFMSGYSGEMLAHSHVYELKGSGEMFLQKPFAAEELIGKIERALEDEKYVSK